MSGARPTQGRSIVGRVPYGSSSINSDALRIDEEPVEFFDVSYQCPDHAFSRRLAFGAIAPSAWDCPRCGKPGALLDSAGLDIASDLASETNEGVGQPRVPRTHYDIVRERRTEAELQVILDERLAILRSNRTFTSYEH